MRLKVLSYITTFLFILLGVGLGTIQLVNGSLYRRLAEENRIRLVPISATRGTIFDRNGTVLVKDTLCFNLLAIPQELKDPHVTFAELGKILNVRPEELEQGFQKGFTAPFAPVTIAKDIDKKTAIVIEEAKLNLPGIIVQAKPLREYAYKTSACHLLGYLGEINASELKRLRSYGYNAKDLVGRSGVEEAYDSYLRGEYGGMQVEVDSFGRLVKVLSYKPPAEGKDIHLTIDIELQRLAEKILNGASGAFIVMDPKTGEILAMASSPGFDPNIFVLPGSDEKVLKVLSSPRRVLLNRAIQGLYPPGSTFKPVVAAAGLEMRKIHPATEFDCQGVYNIGGYKFRCWEKRGHGHQNLSQALINSCNIYFYNLGRKIGQKAISNYARLFEFGAPTGIDLPAEASGLVPSRGWKRFHRGKPWFEGDTLNYSIGQSFLMATPIQLLRAISAIANGGILVEPYVVKRIGDVETGGKKKFINIRKSTIEAIREGLNGVVDSESGTGRRAKVPGVKMAAKTGTAQAGRGRGHAWFVGYVPSEDPKISFVVICEHGGPGGGVPAEMAKEFILRWKTMTR